MKLVKWTLMLIPVVLIGWFLLGDEEPVSSDIELTEASKIPPVAQKNNAFQTKPSKTSPAEQNRANGASAPAAKAASLSQQAQQQRQDIEQELSGLRNCKQTASCPVDDSDPRAASFLLAKQISEQLQRYAQLHKNHQYYDQQTADITRQFLNYPDGHVQSAALDLMQAQPANQDTAEVLIDALQDSYDGKVMHQAMDELQRYPQLEPQIRELFTHHLKTGAFNLAQELAKNIGPYLNANNIGYYNELADSLPPRSAKARYLKTAILEAEYAISGG